MTWHCPKGCNNFQSDQYQLDEPPECASCGADMSTESDSFDAVHLAIEEADIALFEQALQETDRYSCSANFDRRYVQILFRSVMLHVEPGLKPGLVDYLHS